MKAVPGGLLKQLDMKAVPGGLLKQLERKLLRIDPRAQAAALRRIGGDTTVRPGLERAIGRFLDGYRIAMHTRDPTHLVGRLDTEVEPDLRGFAFEGAGMYLALSDQLARWRATRLPGFLRDVAPSHDYIISIGAGFALARLPWLRAGAERYAARFGPGLAALVLDGFGFHEAFFATTRTVAGQQRAARLAGVAGRCFDAGVGRALWFVRGASADRIGATIAAFPEPRQADLWAGVGLASAYAGSAYADLDRYVAELRALQQHAGRNRSRLRVGVVFAAETRRKAANPSRWTSRACETLLGMSFQDAARLGRVCWDEAIDELRGRSGADAFLHVHRVAGERVNHRLSGAWEHACWPS